MPNQDPILAAVAACWLREEANRNPHPILAAVAACCAGPTLPTSGDLAAAVIRAAAEQIERLPSGADCADYLEALAAQLDGRDD